MPLLLALVVAVLTVLLPATQAVAASTQVVDVNSANVEANGTSSPLQDISGDGRFVAFSSSATNLVTTDTNDAYDVFVYDRAHQTTRRVSVATDGTQADGSSNEPSISSDGTAVVFTSDATNLVPDDTNGVSDVFVHSLLTGTTTRVSVGGGGAQANRASDGPDIDGDGSRVVFRSAATNLVASDTNGFTDIFVRDLTAQTTTQAGTWASSNGGGGSEPAISANGDVVAFESVLELTGQASNSAIDVFARTLSSGQIVKVSVNDLGVAGDKFSFQPSLSADGRIIAFTTSSTNLDATDTDNEIDVYVRDTVAMTTRLASVPGVDAPGTGGSSTGTAVSDDGRVVAFTSEETNLVAGDTNGHMDTFARNLQTGTTTRVSVSSAGGQLAGASPQYYRLSPGINADGSAVSFTSVATVDCHAGYRQRVLVRDESTVGDGCVRTAPQAATGAAADVSATGATLAGTVDANSEATSYRFEWGTSTSYDRMTTITSAGSGADPVERTAAISGLVQGMTYHFRIVALRFGAVVATGTDATFVAEAARPHSRLTWVDGGAIKRREANGSVTTITTPEPARGSTHSIDFSADGTKLLYVTTDFKLAVAQADGSGRQLIEPAAGTQFWTPQFSPDGTKIVAEIYTPSTFESRLWLMNADGTGRTELTGADTPVSMPVFSPDGMKIVYSKLGTLYSIKPDGTANTPLAAAAGVVHASTVAADGRIFGTKSTQSGNQLFSAPSTGSAATVLGTVKPKSYESLDVAPEGDLVAYVSASGGIKTLKADGSGTQTDVAAGFAPSWQPDPVAAPADTTKPTISITSPVEGAKHLKGSSVQADFSCSDDVAATTCTGTVADGAAIDTATAGAKTFTVNAADAAGNTQTKSVGYAVVEAPSVTTAAADAIGNEGQELTASGAFASGSGGGALALTASNGAAGTFVDNGDGTWTWKLATSDDVARRAITVTATDANGNTATDAFDVEAKNVAPAKPELVGAEMSRPGSTYQLKVVLDDVSPADEAGSVGYAIAWGDGAVDEATHANEHIFSHVYTAEGARTIRVTTTDKDGGKSPEATLDLQVVAPPAAPPVARAGGPYTVDEGGTLSLDGSASSGATDHAWELDGDGDYDDATGATPQLDHAALVALGLGDGPKEFKVKLRATGAGGSTFATVGGTVFNVAPTMLSATPPSGDLVFATVHPWSFTATDPSPADQAALTYSVEWGDGLTGSGASPLSHEWALPGDFTVSVRAVDKNGGQSGAFERVVDVLGTGTAPARGGLPKTEIIGGTPGHDTIALRRVGNKVLIDRPGTSNDERTAMSPNSEIVLSGGGGNDTITVDNRVIQKVTAFGGSGNDTIDLGNARSIGVGGPGADKLSSGRGLDLLFGGTGKDVLASGESQDVVVSGRIPWESPATANRKTLRTLSRDWADTRASYSERIGRLNGPLVPGRSAFLIAAATGRTVFDDGVLDVLTGSDGNDWYLAGHEDTTDATGSETETDLG